MSPLCRSHIVPEFWYRPAYDAHHRAIQIDVGDERLKTVQKGHREYLLCQDCERLLNDSYEKPFLAAWQAVLPTHVARVDHIPVSGLEYALTKLFHLSVLWRCSVAKRQEYADVQLGKKREKRLRQMLLARKLDPKHDVYRVFAELLVDPKRRAPATGLLTAPVHRRLKERHKERNIYSLVFGGCMWNYEVAQRPLDAGNEWALKRDGTLRLRVVDYTSHPIVRAGFEAHIQDLAASKKTPSK